MSIVLHQAQGPAPCSGRKLGARAPNSPVKISPRGHFKWIGLGRDVIRGLDARTSAEG
jgi:hypothetical protein